MSLMGTGCRFASLGKRAAQLRGSANTLDASMPSHLGTYTAVSEGSTTRAGGPFGRLRLYLESQWCGIQWTYVPLCFRVRADPIHLGLSLCQSHGPTRVATVGYLESPRLRDHLSPAHPAQVTQPVSLSMVTDARAAAGAH